MQPMSTAPRDRGILLHLNGSHLEQPYERWVVAHYAQWDGGQGPYGEVWETGPGECRTLDSRDIVGWSELPNTSNEVQSEQWRTGQHYNIHVYQGETPVCTALTPEFARRIVQDHNTLLERGGDDVC